MTNRHGKHRVRKRWARHLRVIARNMGISSHPNATWRRRSATLIGALLLGIMALVFARAADSMLKLFDQLEARWPYAPLLLTPVLFVTAVWLTRRYAEFARGSGIPQVIAASRHPKSKLSAALLDLKTAIIKMGLTLMVLLGGGAAGREGPTVQVSAAIMGAVNRRFGVRMTPGVMIAGGAAGVAAAFNTPLAGIAFAIEELASAYEQRLTVLVMGAVMISGLVSLGVAGDYVYFGRIFDTLSVSDTAIYAPIAGVIGGIAGGLFARLLLAQARSEGRVMRALNRRPILFALGCGLAVAMVGIATQGATFGTGYETTRHLLAGNDVTLWYGPGKFVAAAATALSGAPGGIFAPSLAVGAGLGQLIAAAAGGGAPIVLLGMTAYFVGVVRAPFTAVIIVSEATGNHGMILSLFATAVIAEWVSAFICPTRLYHGLAETFLARSARAKLVRN